MSKLRQILLLIFIATFAITVLLTFYGIWFAWNYDKELPYLSILISISIVEVAACIIWLFKQIFSSNTKVLKQLILNSLVLSKAIFLKFLKKGEDIRLSLLLHNDKDNTLTMFAQDSEYTDKDFKIFIDEGYKQKIIVCEVLKHGNFISKKLTIDHFIQYPNSSIPIKISSVMATPIKDKQSQIIGVLSLDSTKDFNAFKAIKEEDIKEVLLSLRNLIESIISEKNINTYE